jgi:hypothetical protein
MMDGEWSDGKEKDERLSMTVVAPSIYGILQSNTYSR